MLNFDEASHRYDLDGVPVKNVTSIIGHLNDFSMIPKDKLEIARQKGVHVHKMVEMDCAGKLDEDTLPEWMRPVLVQWRLFVAQTGFKVIASERRVYHPVYGYAGTLDLYGILEHAKKPAFIDVKRSFFAGQAIGMQVAAYKEAYIAQEGDKAAKKALRFGLRLNEINHYRMEQYEDESQFQDFLTCLAHQRLLEKYA